MTGYARSLSQDKVHKICLFINLFLKAFSIYSCQANQMNEYNLKVNTTKCKQGLKIRHY